MTKIILPLLAALALSSAAAVAQTPRPGKAEAAGPHMPSPAEMAAHHKQMCQDEYAHQVGDLAYLEARLSLTTAQQPLFDRWKSVKLDIAKRGAADCATRELPRGQGKMPTPLDAMAHEEENLKRRLTDLDAEIPVLGAFYNALTQAQKDALSHPGQPAMMMMAHRRDFGPGMPPRMDHGGPPGALGGPGPNMPPSPQ